MNRTSIEWVDYTWEPVRSFLDLTDDDSINRSFINGKIDWVIMGAETGTQKCKVRPKRYWIENIVEVCDKNGIPVFMEKNLRPYYKEDFRWEYLGRKPRRRLH